MKTYKVTYKEHLIHEFYVQAENRTEAEREFYKQAIIGKINFSNGEVYNTHVHITEKREDN